MIINHNLPALNTYNRLTLNNSGMSKSLEKLSSGLRINRAADDAAGLAISEKMRAQIRGLDQAGRNAQDGISLIQTAEGALNETHSILQRMRELSVQAANDTYTAQDRTEIQKEIDQLTSEIDRIANTTQFNTKNLLDGSTSALVATDKLTTKVFMRDGLRVLDQFGQKAAGGGNYQLDITTAAGTNQVQKTDIFKVKHAASTEGVQVTDTAIVNQKACVQIAVVCACLSAGANLLLDFKFTDGMQYSITVAGTGAAVNGLDIACAINANADLSKRLNTICTVCATLVLCDKNAGENFVLTATLTEGTAPSAFAFGALNPVAVGCVAAGSVDTATGCVAVMTVAGSGAASGITSATFVGASNANSVTAQISCTAAAATAASVANFIGISVGTSCQVIDGAACAWNASLLFEVASINSATCAITYNIKANLYKASTGEYVYQEATATLIGGCSTGCAVNIGGFRLNAMCTCVTGATAVGCQIVMNLSGATSGATDTLCVNVGGAGDLALFNFDQNVLDNKTSSFKFFQFGANGGAEEVTLSVNNGVVGTASNVMFTLEKAAATSGIGSIASLSTKLYDIDKFWDTSGNFILEKPQAITLVQGNGNKATITLSSSDTLADVRDKLNEAIADQLGQANLAGIGDDTDKFASYVTKAEEDGLETVAGTFIIRSAVAGTDGEITFAGADSVLNALGLTTVQKATSNNFTVDVTDAHTGNVIAADVKIGDNNLVGIIHENVDVQFDMSTGVVTTWDDTTKNFVLAGGSANSGETFVHLADNTMVFHIGANQQQDIGMGIGNMGASSLGVSNVQVTSNALANDGIGKIDSAIARVSSERAKLGALQNRLEHTINNLSTTSENLTASESRIRDVDMAKEMMAFTKYQILSNAATAMLAQANQMPQSVLQLLR